MLPPLVKEALRGSRKILLAGCGGGYDVFGAVPLLMPLIETGHEVVLANLSFASLRTLTGTTQHPNCPNLYAVPADAATTTMYCPEAWLARYLRDHLSLAGPIWGFEKTGVRPLRRAYETLIEEQQIDAIVLIDGGVDAILRGDESSLGTPEEDLASLAAVSSLPIATKLIACIGFGAELREGICHEQVLHRIAELTRAGGYLGATGLGTGDANCDRYMEAVALAFLNQEQHRRSHIHGVITAALRGEFGATAPHVWLSPLMSLMWFFSLPTVAGSHLFVGEVADTETIWDVTARVEGLRKTMRVRDRTTIPI